MASKKASNAAKKKKSGAVIPFPAVPRRSAEIDAKLPFAVIPTREAPANKAAPKAASAEERPAASFGLRGWKWWEIGLVASLCLHLAAAAVFQAKYVYDLERAAGAAAAASAEGSLTIPVDVVLAAPLPTAPTPINATAPDAVKPAQTIKAESEEPPSSPPQRNEAALEVVPIAKETPHPEKDRRERKERAQKSASAAANPSPAAASRAEGRAGAGGHTDSGGTANVSSYRAQLWAHLQHYKVRPAEARTGTAWVRFSLAANGRVISSALARTSGAGALDEAALSTVRRASPFPPFPPGLARSQMDIDAPITFDLR